MKTDFDFRANMLGFKIEEHWEPQVKASHVENKKRILSELEIEYGTLEKEGKSARFLDMGILPFSVVAYHNTFLRQARTAYVMGAYYPALTASCALGERILNHLMLKLRENFKATPEYKKVYRKNSFDNWAQCIDTLSSWGIFRSCVADCFGKLSELRNSSLHFNAETDIETKRYALEALRLISKVVDLQFGAFGLLPWFIEDTPGAAFIKKSEEENPFIQLVYLPMCIHVGPKHKLTYEGGRFIVETDPPCEAEDVSDEHFAALFNKGPA